MPAVSLAPIALMLEPLKRSKDSGPHAGRRPWTGRAGFTLIELLAVVMVILLLAGIVLSVTGYVQNKMSITTAKTQIVAMGAALEMYKNDWGSYPVTGSGRISRNQSCEGSNNLVLYRALSGVGGGRKYLSFPASAIRTNMYIPVTISGNTTSEMCGVFDPWGKLYNYYNSPNTSYAVIQTNAYAGYTCGGQINSSTYDLFSYGPDGATFVPGSAAAGNAWTAAGRCPYTNSSAANDDIANWK